MHDIAPAPASRHGRTLPIARLATLALVLALAACKGQGDGKDGEGKDDANKPPEAVAVEVARAARRPIATTLAAIAGGSRALWWPRGARGAPAASCRKPRRRWPAAHTRRPVPAAPAAAARALHAPAPAARQ